MAPSKEKEVLSFLLHSKDLQDNINNKNSGIIKIYTGLVVFYTKDILAQIKISSTDFDIILDNLYANGLISKIESKHNEYRGKMYSIYLPDNFISLFEKYKNNHQIILNEGKKELIINGKNISITEKSESYPLDLLRTLFKEKNKIWANDEIFDDWTTPHTERKDRLEKKQIYQAGLSVNEKISRIIGIENPFLIVTTKDVAINTYFL